MKKLLSAVLASTLLSVSADEPFFQASLTPDIAIHSRDTTIKGIALSIWGENPQSAFALGFVNGSTGDSSGFSWGLVNYAENYTGVHWSVVNMAKGEFVGWQAGFLNYGETFVGLQLGAVNVANKCTGVQFGFVNYAKELEGIQIGWVNIVEANPWFTEFPNKLAKGFVFVNWSF